jgi:hypothetical protein
MLFADLLIDLRTLAKAAREDFVTQRWDSYRNYIDDFNRLLPQVESEIGATGLNAIAHVPASEVAYGLGPGYGTTAEKAKLREIVNSSERLLERAEYNASPATTSGAPAALERIETICNRLHVVAHQLRVRHARRATLDIEDEYDVQDLFHSLLRIYFDDVRPEEWTPSHAGASSRVDFLLKDEKVVVEIKKTRKGLADREIGEQLIIDIERYEHHPDCKTLVCFVYDPEARIANPRGVENDLMRTERKLRVIVAIRPKRRGGGRVCGRTPRPPRLRLPRTCST